MYSRFANKTRSCKSLQQAKCGFWNIYMWKKNEKLALFAQAMILQDTSLFICSPVINPSEMSGTVSGQNWSDA